MYSQAYRSFYDQSERCEAERANFKRTCEQIYLDLQGVQKTNRAELESIQSELGGRTSEARTELLAKVQEYRRVESELDQTIADTASVQQIGLKTMSDLVSCYRANAKIYEENAKQAEQVLSAMGEGVVPPTPEDQRTVKDKYIDPLRDKLLDTVTSSAITGPLNYGVQKVLPEVARGAAGLGLSAGEKVLSPSSTSKCDSVNLDPINAYDKGCRVDMLPSMPGSGSREPAAEPNAGEQHD